MSEEKGALYRLRRAFSTFNLTTLLVCNLFLIVLVVLALALFTYWLLTTWFGADGRDLLNIPSALIVVFALSIVIAISMVVMIRLMILAPVQRMVEAMNRLAAGDFSARMSERGGPFEPVELREFAHSFNVAAEELGGTELLRKDFVNNFSHEFKTPIVAMNGFAELLLEEDLPEEDRREYLGIIRDESARLAQLSTSVLTLNKVESQSILAVHEPFSLDEQLRQSVLVVEQKWAARRLRFEVELEPVELTGDEALMKEVWLNLLDNAAKFSEEGGLVEVRLEDELYATEDRFATRAVARVRDHGIGMEPECQRHIFEQFYQADSSHATQGNGLGLAMVKKIVELHGGTVSVESAPGEGSTFTVELPLT